MAFSYDKPPERSSGMLSEHGHSGSAHQDLQRQLQGLVDLTQFLAPLLSFCGTP